MKAEAEDGKTPTFQVSDAGIWQIDLGDGQGWRDVTYANGQPVSAITDTPTEDKFFQTVEVVGDSLHIVMKGGEELNVPIVKDFLCQIVTESEGVQLFDVGVTREFTVNMRGVETTLVTAPEGWTAELTEPVDGADGMKTALLRVTSPSAGGTRATASTSKDVSILATSGKYACLAKIQVESTGVDPNAPRITVANSTTVVPTHSTLTFDVVLTNATTWKYICQPTGDTAPTAETILSEGTKGSGTSVTVSDLSGDTAYTIYVVAYEGAKVSEVASVENRTKAAPIDYYQNYQDGKDIMIGDLVVNISTYPDAQLLKPSELTNDIISNGGLIFVDNSDDTDMAFEITGESINMGEIVMIGRYPQRAQATVSGPEMRCKFNAAFKNLRIVESMSDKNLFTTTNATYDPTLYVEDCTIIPISNVIYDSHNTFNFKKVCFSNSIIKLVTANKPFYSTKAKASYTQQLISLKNNVFYAEEPMQNYIVNMGDGKTAYQTNQLAVEVIGNTFYNIYQPNIMIRAYILTSLNVSENVGYYDGTINAKNYLTGVYDVVNFSDDQATVSYNYLYTDPVTTSNFWSLKHTGNYQPTNNQNGEGAPDNPFLSADVMTGYFPINASVVTTGAGATYDTKLWMSFE